MTVSLVTGGCGFVGAAIARALKARGDDVIVLDLAPECPVEGVDYRRIDITDKAAVMEACRGVDTIIHNASIVHTKRNKQDVVWSVNLGGTENMLEAAQQQGVPRFVYISSGSVVYEGKDIENGDESLPYSSVSQAPYADSKIAAEKLVLAQNGKGGVATCALRPHVIFGPGDNRFMPALLAKGRNGQLRVQIGRGVWLSDYTYVSNLTDAVLLADEALAKDGLNSIAAGQAYFITNGEPMPFWDFIRKVAARLGFPPVKYRAPKTLVYMIATVMEGIDTLKGGTLNAEDGLTRFAIRYMCTHHYFSIEKARRDLGYNPSVTVDEGIERTCQHLEATGAV
ncbi:MAG: NAD-dependent epimerase/dehydratase family protein [Deltaproteobacteria bacterium]|nr:NAD-dependent epimerase/dehydratase family protein [Deltaproteobacteria bacterium]MBW2209941.1 NAD-dependent epimerase/dehydratase family protein [Deltaproteobacteria bacterium]MBW2213004.1 NAD-dependent epimerase/dehydratase family protein [Deltaproteobacteria bacterium]MBW2380184.1 NAD-dependent epimerase/dehydratase family protein [Deltaproteobacteria bacterium]MBW2550080.1 NAD-dependent epimerase/dehydratase family protein [Deltaproteobacteria bacterium]